MWQQSAFSKRRQSDSDRRRFGGGGGSLHIRRVKAEVRVNEEVEGGETKIAVAAARLLLNDFSPTCVSVFTQQALPVGIVAAITIERPKRFYCRCRIVGCEMMDTHVFANGQGYVYRTRLRFQFESEEEAKTVREYSEDLEQKYVYGDGLAEAA